MGWLLLSVVLTGCEGFTEPMPDWVANRNPLPACGTEDLRAGGDPDVAARTCLLDAYLAGRGAELIFIDLNELGAPITSYVRVHENGTIETFMDMPGDGPGSWERFRCEHLVPAVEARGPLPSGTVFVREGCEMLPIP